MRIRWSIVLLMLGIVSMMLRFGWRWLGRLLGLPTRFDTTRETNLPVAMPDGVRLMADHYHPKTDGSFPTILIRSTYGRGSDAPFPINLLNVVPANLIAACGYHVIVQTVRGRFDSEGNDDEAFADAVIDGRATAEWIAQQPWFNGSLSMFGSSYLGFVQWAVAAAAPPYLKAIAPSIITTRMFDIIYPDGALAQDTVQRWTLIVEKMDDGARLPEMARSLSPTSSALRRSFDHLPIQEADQVLVGSGVPFYQNALSSRCLDDPLWQYADLRAVPPQTTIPVHLMGGWYDFCLRELLNDYAAMKGAGRTPYLTIGPWVHADLLAQPTYLRESVRWYEAHLKGDKRRLRAQPVRIYMMGANQWHEMACWPPPTHETRYYLGGQALLSPDTPPAELPPDRYRYDPANPTPAVGGPLFMPPQVGGPKDNRALEARPDVLTYTTPVLLRNVEIIGPVKLELYVQSSLEHTDFFGRLCDVYPDGSSMNVCDGLFRVTPGGGERQPDGTLKVLVDMWSTAYRFRAGHRIRLQVSSGAHPRWNRNTGSGEPPATATRLCIADQAIYHDAAHPSALILPVSG